VKRCCAEFVDARRYPDDADEARYEAEIVAAGPHSGPYGTRVYRRVRCADRSPPAALMIKAHFYISCRAVMGTACPRVRHDPIVLRSDLTEEPRHDRRLRQSVEGDPGAVLSRLHGLFLPARRGADRLVARLPDARQRVGAGGAGCGTWPPLCGQAAQGIPDRRQRGMAAGASSTFTASWTGCCGCRTIWNCNIPMRSSRSRRV